MNTNFLFKESVLKGLYEITSFCREDERGNFKKDYSVDVFRNNGLSYELKEVFYTTSKKGVIRALHFQEVKEQSKLVRVIKGRIYDVCVDIRPDSETFGKYISVELSEENNKQLLIPKGFAHGYLVLEDSIVSYKCDEIFYQEYDSGIIWNDKELNIKWHVEGIDKLIISEKDKNLQSFEEYKKRIGL